MAFMPRKAQRCKTKLRLAICGASGSGKTFSSLLMAFGITGDWDKIGFIDTEAGSGELYVGASYPGGVIGEYDYYRIDPPFTAEKYIEAIAGFEKMGKEVIVVDSLTHAWAGAGGLLDKQGKIADASRSGNSYTAWRQVTPDHNRLVDSILQNKAHVIATMRSKQDYVQDKDDKGKTVVRKVGMAPIQRDGMEYEFTVVIDVDANHVATASKDRTRLFDGLYFQPEVKTGEALLEWLNTGVDAPSAWEVGIKAIKEARDMAQLQAAFANAYRYAKAAGDEAKIKEATEAKDEAKESLEKALSFAGADKEEGGD